MTVLYEGERYEVVSHDPIAGTTAIRKDAESDIIVVYTTYLRAAQ